MKSLLYVIVAILLVAVVFVMFNKMKNTDDGLVIAEEIVVVPNTVVDDVAEAADDLVEGGVAEEVTLDSPLKITNAYAFQTSKSQTAGAVFMTIENSSDQEYRLMGATSDNVDSVELHRMRMIDDKMEMRKQAEIRVRPNRTVELEPTGFHIMLIGLKEPLKKGETLPLRVIMSGGNSFNIDVDIVKAGEKPKS